MVDARPVPGDHGRRRPVVPTAMPGMSDRTAGIIASRIAASRVEVVPFPRLKLRGLAVRQRQTIYIRPGEVDLLEFLLLAQSISVPRFSTASLDLMTGRYRFVCRRLLQYCFPGVARIPESEEQEGRDPIGVSPDEVGVRPLGGLDSPSGHGELATLSMPSQRADDDPSERAALHAWLDDPANWIRPPRPPMNAALARMPMTVVGAMDRIGGSRSRYRSRIENPAARGVIDRMLECYRRSLQGVEDMGDDRRRSFGRHLDANGLHDLALMVRGVPGPPPKAFRRSRRRINDSFDPAAHAAIVMIDANAFEREDGVSIEQRDQRPLTLAAALIEVLHRLEMPFGIVMYADQLRSGRGGPPVYVNRPIVVKRPTDRWDDAAILQLESAFSAGSQPPWDRAKRATLESVHFEHGLELARRWFGDRSPPRSLHVSYLGLDGPGLARPTDRQAARRVAMDIDAQLVGIREAMELDSIGGIAMVAQELRDAAPVGSEFEDLRVTW